MAKSAITPWTIGYDSLHYPQCGIIQWGEYSFKNLCNDKALPRILEEGCSNCAYVSANLSHFESQKSNPEIFNIFLKYF